MSLQNKKEFLRLHPPSGGVDETPEQKAAREAEEAREAKLVERIAAGVSGGLKPVMERLAEREQPVTQTRTEPAVTTIARPTEEQLAEALIDGNKQEYARLLKQQRAADQQENQRALAALSSQGGAAISSVSQSIAEQNPDYKRFKKEIDSEIASFRNANPGQIVTPEHLKIATEIVKSRHIDEIVNERIEEQRRQAREAEDALLPQNQHVESEREEKEPTSLAEALGTGDWKKEFREKSRGVGGRTDDEELRRMGFQNGLPDYLNQRKKISQIEDEVGSGMGLDRDWVWTDKAKGEGHWV
jgi:hypothetical protein